ncbi:hypothetical protein K402DRAFT_362069 [Aulographum hederae CBS 113979]|uniref:C2H2-type domain-containing protein n=1 Tax=Aulographum hederae CBS 113979 TaxID=1176131 RepID=A0A6G1GPW9_9PEZI|nr:hypothetical protein K402DRAFT_362069 [Aulographum hederae CBS 113979]
MDGRNSNGRRISLLNESENLPVHRPTSTRELLPHRPSYSSSFSSQSSSFARSRSSSYTSSSQTPSLVRSDSSDSRAMQTPSPITPTFGFDSTQRLDPALFTSGAPFYPQGKELEQPPMKSMSAYPPIRQQVPQYQYPAPDLTSNTTSYFPGAESPVAQQRSVAKPPSKKNTYPCPLATEYNCGDYFTTSGHAARHAKKHTGRKDAICPDCSKAFTRKDNMEQHRRTHANGRSSTKASSSSDSRSKPKSQQSSASSSSKRPKTVALQAPSSAIDPALPASPASSFGMVDPFAHQVHPYPLFNDPTMAYPPMPSAYERNNSYTSGLDTLAIAATGEGSKRRKLDA